MNPTSSSNDITMQDENTSEVVQDESRQEFEQNLLDVFLHANEQTLSDAKSGGYDELLNVMEQDTRQNKPQVFHIQESGLSNPVAFLEEHNPSSNIDEEIEKKIIRSPEIEEDEFETVDTTTTTTFLMEEDVKEMDSSDE